jgi:hypothetical protein
MTLREQFEIVSSDYYENDNYFKVEHEGVLYFQRLDFTAKEVDE